jgi:hypothetical protein
MRRSQAIMILGLLGACAQCALADALPQRRSGLWETHMIMAQHPGPGITSQQCIDAQTDEAMQRRVMEGDATLKCTRTGFSKIPGGFESSSVCKTNRGTLTSKMHITGDLQSAYRMEISGHRDPPQGALTDTHTVVEARWLGACPADMQAGDMRMNGRTLHMGAGAAGTAGAASPSDPQAMKSMTPEQRREYLKRRLSGGEQH